MIRVARLVLVVAALCAATSAHAQTQSRKRGSFELGAGNFTPNIDAGTTTAPYDLMFGDSRGWLFRAAYNHALYTRFGSLEAGVLSGFFRRSADAFVVGTDPPERSGDVTTLNVIPTSLTLTYRFDRLLEGKPSIPIAPYVRGSLERYNWWISNQKGMAEKGATNGLSVTGGIALALDWFDRSLGREMDTEFGINHTYLYFDATKSWIDDFGSSSSWDMSGKELMLSGGLLFAF